MATTIECLTSSDPSANYNLLPRLRDDEVLDLGATCTGLPLLRASLLPCKIRVTSLERLGE